MLWGLAKTCCVVISIISECVGPVSQKTKQIQKQRKNKTKTNKKTKSKKKNTQNKLV